ncbi:MAG: acyltransferase [Siculibacillus sp.]
MQSTPGTSKSPRFLWPIDLLRFAFAAFVVVGHSYGFARLGDESWRVAYLDRVLPGGLWVTGFFVLSGYCIVAAERLHAEFDPRRYFAARLTRILPLYVLFFAASIVAEAIFAVVGGRPPSPWDVLPWTLATQLTMTQGLFGPFGAFNPSWSLTHELICYFAWGALMAGVGRNLRSWQMIPLALVPFLVTALIHAVVHQEVTWRVMSLPLYFFVWLLGAAAAETRHADLSPRRRATLIAAGAAFLVPLVWYFADPRVPETVGMVAFGIVLAIACLWLPFAPPAGPMLDRLSRLLGLASYPLYLGHGIVVVGITVAEAHLPFHVDPLVHMIVTVGIAVVLSIVLGTPLERRILVWRAAWLKRNYARDRANGPAPAPL